VIYTKDQQAIIVEALKAKRLERRCPMCLQSSGWHLLEGLIALPMGALSTMSPKVAPCVGVACRNCGNTVLYNIFFLGIGPQLGIFPTPPEGF
jgi:hypothetical protein